MSENENGSHSSKIPQNDQQIPKLQPFDHLTNEELWERYSRLSDENNRGAEFTRLVDEMFNRDIFLDDFEIPLNLGDDQ